MGNLDKSSGRMSPAKTVFKLRSTPAPSLTAALGAKAEVSPAPNRYAAPVSLIRSPRITETRTVSQLGDSPATQVTPPDVRQKSKDTGETPARLDSRAPGIRPLEDTPPD